jgi:hypothetical protein
LKNSNSRGSASALSGAPHSPLKAIKGNHLAKPNYQYEKRQRDLAKKKKQEEKRQQKLANKSAETGADAAEAESGSTEGPESNPDSGTASDA